MGTVVIGSLFLFSGCSKNQEATTAEEETEVSEEVTEKPAGNNPDKKTDKSPAEVANKAKIDRQNFQALLKLSQNGNSENVNLYYPKHPNSVNLYLLGKHITDEDVKQLANVKEMHELCLAHTEITAESIPIIAKIPGLINLDIAGIRLDNKGLKPLANHPTLKRIVINETAVTAAGLETLATIPNLDCLEVYKCFITDSGMKHVAKMVNLTKISLDSTKVTDKGILQLTPLTKLRRLQVWDTEVTAEGIVAFQEVMPNVYITR